MTCPTCGGESTSTNPDYPYCKVCHYSGLAAMSYPTVRAVCEEFERHGFHVWVDQTGGGTMTMQAPLTEAHSNGPYCSIGIVDTDPPDQWEAFGGATLFTHPQAGQPWCDWIADHEGCPACAGIADDLKAAGYDTVSEGCVEFPGMSWESGCDVEAIVPHLKAIARAVAAHPHEEAS